MEQSRFPGLGVLEKADLLVVFFRRRALLQQQMDGIRAHLSAGKPLVGLRTANHAFSVRGKVPDGFEAWSDFAPEVLGCGNYGYGPVEAGTEVRPVPDAIDHPTLDGIDQLPWHSKGNLYYVKPIDSAATLLLQGVVKNDVEPIAWTRKHNKSRVFYTSLGHASDFDHPQFRQLLVNAIYWAMNQQRPAGKTSRRARPMYPEDG